MKISAIDLKGEYYELTDAANFYERFVTGVPGSWEQASRRVKHRTENELMRKLSKIENVFLIDYRLRENDRSLRETLAPVFPNMTSSRSITRNNVYELVYELSKMASAHKDKAFICSFFAKNNSCNMLYYWQIYEKSDYRKLMLGQLITQLP